MISQLSKCDDLQNFANPKFSAKHGGWTNVYGNNRHPDNSLNDGQILFYALYSYCNRTKMVIVIWKLLYQVHTSCIVMEAFVNKERDS